jgi:hypothetical protein
MKFSQDYISSQISQSKSDIEKFQQRVDREREFLSDFLLSQGYKKVNNFYVHPDYIEVWEERRKTTGYYGDFPEDAVFPCP